MLLFAVSIPMRSHISSIPIFNGLNSPEWSEQIRFYFGVMDLDLSLQIEEPYAITVSSTEGEKIHYKNWEKIN